MTRVRRLLVANRGEVASRVFATARRMGLGTVAVYADPDEGLPFVRQADVAVRLPGSTAAETYLSTERLLAAAERSGADAIHPGYGFLAESAAFAQAVVDAGLTWIGPPPEVIALMGDKVAAKEVAGGAGVPLLPGVVLEGDDPDAWSAAVDGADVGYPLVVKAAAGGGGRGMRVVPSAEQLAEAVTSARREAGSAFGDPTVFAERLVAGGRHIEVQVLADAYGGVVHLGERECSIQRRHQKVVEESPAPMLDEGLRAAMCEAAVGLAGAIGYVGAGTVELLVDESGDEPTFSFLEMNTRLQVEHRVTELRLGGVDLVEWQLRIAAGEELPLWLDDDLLQGHAIEVRLYAEDPARDDAPGFGELVAFEPGECTVVDSTVEAGSTVATSFDPMLAKLVEHAPSRLEASARLARALRTSAIHGVATNRDLLVAVLESPAFRAGDTTIDFLEKYPELRAAGPDDDVRRVHEAAAGLVRAAARQERSRWPFAPAGWRHRGVDGPGGPAGGARVVRLERLEPTATGGERWTVTFELDGLTHTARVHLVGDLAGDDPAGSTAYVNTAAGQTAWAEEPRFVDPGAAAAAAAGPVAPVPGTVASVAVAVGDAVEAGQTLVVLEAMKMEHRIDAPAAGTVDEVLVAPGDRVDAHQLLIRLGPAGGGRLGA